VHRDGNLYYASHNLEITRLTPAGMTTLLVPNLASSAESVGAFRLGEAAEVVK